MPQAKWYLLGELPGTLPWVSQGATWEQMTGLCPPPQILESNRLYCPIDETLL